MTGCAPGRRWFLRPAALCCMLLVTTALAQASRPASTEPTTQPAAAASQPAQRPNIVFILADDLRDDFIGCAGHPFIKTPAIDRLASDGVRYANSFVITPLCGPSRATLLTGQRTYVHRVSTNGKPLPHDVPTFLPMLKAAGYATGLFGRSNRAIRPREFDRTFALMRVTGDGLEHELADWISAVRPAPLFALVTLRDPHLPYVAPTRHRNDYADVEIAAPPAAQVPLDALPPLLRRGATATPVCVGPLVRREFEKLKHEFPGRPLEELTRSYARQIGGVDDAVAAVRRAIRQTDTHRQTVIIFTSDNGMMLGERGLIGKELAYEPAIRVPLIVYDPRRPRRAGVATRTVLNTDWAPTILALAGVPVPSGWPGRDILAARWRAPAGAGESAWRDAWLMTSAHAPKTTRPAFLAVRSPSWKYVRYVHGQLFEELFDLASDPHEAVNLAGNPAHAATLENGRQQMRRLLREHHLPATFFDAN